MKKVKNWKLSRKEKERQLHREEIGQVAVEMFSQKGFSNTTVQEIAKNADFSIGTVYNLFGSKERLYKFVILEAFKHIEAIIHSMTPDERSNPSKLDAGRKKRIAKGSGRNIQEVNQLLKQFDQMSKMMKMMQGGGGKKMMQMMQNMK